MKVVIIMYRKKESLKMVLCRSDTVFVRHKWAKHQMQRFYVIRVLNLASCWTFGVFPLQNKLLLLCFAFGESGFIYGKTCIEDSFFSK